MLPELIPYRKGNKWGFCDKNKNIKIECRYGKVRPFKEGLAAVTYDGDYPKWGFIDKNGNEVIKCRYKKVTPFSNGYSCVTIKNSFYIDVNDEILDLGNNHNFLFPFYNNVACVGNFTELDNEGDEGVVEYQYINSNGNILDDFKITENVFLKYEKVKGIRYSPIFVFEDTVFNLFECKKLSLPFLETNERHISYFSEGVAPIKNKRNLFGYCDYNEKITIPHFFDYATDFINGKAVVVKDKKYHIIDKGGNIVTTMPKGIKLLNPMENGVFISYNYKFGVVDSCGNTIIPLKYDGIVYFKEDIAIVKQILKSPRGAIIETEGCIDLFGTEYWED